MLYLFIFAVIVLLIFEGVIGIIKNKLSVESEGILYTHVNKSRLIYIFKKEEV